MWTRRQLTMLTAPVVAALGIAMPAFPGASPAQATAEELRQHWLEMQTDTNRQSKQEWWQDLGPGELEAFIEAGVDVNVRDRRGWAPLHSAARYNEDPVVLSLLVRAGAAVDAKDNAGDTPLHWAAAENRNVEIVQALLEAGADVNARDRFGWQPLHTAAETSSNPEVIAALLAAGAKRNTRAYFVLFRPVFLLKHNKNLSGHDKKSAMALLKGAD